MFSKNKKSQAGFSLVELMVVVAIIGVLASIAVPSINKYLAKARQTEAKTSLSSLYTSEKAFFAEYTAYHGMFGAVGYAPEGKLRYNVGFTTVTSEAGVSNGYNATPPAPGNVRTTSAYCGTTGVIGTAGCTVLNGATNATAPAVPAAGTITVNTFTAAAIARITTSAGADDIWTMDQNKELRNTQDGIR
jgi:type IV pilus assembly protein PilA